MKNSTLLEIPSIYFPDCFYRITFSPDLSYLKLDASKKSVFQTIHSQIQEDPEKYLFTLEAFYRDHLDVPEVANLLAFAYLRLKKINKQKSLLKSLTRYTLLTYVLKSIMQINVCDIRKPKKSQLSLIINVIY